MNLVTDVSSLTAIPWYRPGLSAEPPLEEGVPEQTALYHSVSPPSEGLSSTAGQAKSVPGRFWILGSLAASSSRRARSYVLGTTFLFAPATPQEDILISGVGRESITASVTSPVPQAPALERELVSRIGVMLLQGLEDGMTSDLGTALADLLDTYGTSVTNAIASGISAGKLSPELASHTLRWLGRLDHPSSFRGRLWLLKHSLLSSSPVVRDGGALGLASLGSPFGLPSLRAAIQRERLPELRRDMEQVVGFLERGG